MRPLRAVGCENGGQGEGKPPGSGAVLRFTGFPHGHDRVQSCAIALRSPASERPSDHKRIFSEYSPHNWRSRRPIWSSAA
eukprot:scaffold40401_cov70-Phaeocystis_antarctica.AAC.2